MQPHYVVAPVRETSNFAIASLILGIASWFFFWLVVPQILAVIFGYHALKDTKEQNLNGRIQAIWGMVLGGIVLVPTAIVGILFVIGLIGSII